MKHFINLKDIPAKDLRKILTDARKRKNARKKLNNADRTLSPCNVCDVDGGLIGNSHAQAWKKIL